MATSSITEMHEETTVFDNTDHSSSVLDDGFSAEWDMSEGEKLLRTGISPIETYGSN